MTHFTLFSQNEVGATINYKIFNNNCNGSSLEAYPCFPPVTQIAIHVLLNGNCRRLIRRADLSFQNFIKLSTVLSHIICSYISHKVKVLFPLWGWVIHSSIMTFWWHFSWILTKWLKSESLGEKRWYGDALSGLLIPSLCKKARVWGCLFPWFSTWLDVCSNNNIYIEIVSKQLWEQFLWI